MSYMASYDVASMIHYRHSPHDDPSFTELRDSLLHNEASHDVASMIYTWP